MPTDGGRRILFLDPNLRTPIDTVVVDDAAAVGVPTDLAVSSDGTTLYLALARDDAGRVLHIRRLDGAVLERRRTAGPPRLALLPRERVLLVADGGALEFLTTDRLARERSVAVCDGSIGGLAPLRAGDRLYVSCRNDRVAEIDVRQRRLVRRVPLGDTTGTPPCEAAGMVLSPLETAIYLACARAGVLLRLDRASLTLRDTIALGSGVGAVTRVRPGLLLISLPERREIAIVDVERRGRATRLRLAGRPVALAAGASGRRGYVLTRGDGDGSPDRISRIDVAARTVRGGLPLSRPERGLAPWPGDRTPVLLWSAAPAPR